MAEPLLDYWSDKQQIIVALIQELTSVMFQLFCLSRLGTDEIFSNLILFLTLIIFAGPYLNTWITFIHHIFIKEDIKKYLPVAIFIMVMHGLGAFFASLLVVNISRDWADNIIWKPKPVYNPIHYTNITESDGTQKTIITSSQENLGVEFFEEMTGVTSLLIGCVYLFWLQKHEKIQEKIDKLKKDKNPTPFFDINFFLRLTLLVASVSRAFPSAHFSFHISVYLRGMELISWNQFGVHLAGGFTGLFITIFLVQFRKYVYGVVPPSQDNTQSVSIFTNQKTEDSATVAAGSNTLFRQNRYTPLRVSLQGGNYL
jgi:hypothetical protein